MEPMLIVTPKSNGCEFQSYRPDTQVCNHVNIYVHIQR